MENIIHCTDMFGIRKIQSAEYTDEIKEMQKTVVSFEIKLFKKLLKEANKMELDGACKFAMKLHDDLKKHGLILSLFARNYSEKEVDDARITIKVLLSHLNGEYMRWFKTIRIYYGKPTAKVFIDDNIFEYNKNDDCTTKIAKAICSVFNVYKQRNSLLYPQFHVGVDFDGVIHEHNLGFSKNLDNLFVYNINKEIQELLKTLKFTFNQNIKISIVTMRGYDSQNVKMVEEYLKHHKIPFDEVTTKIEPSVNMMIDDNAVLLQSIKDMDGLIEYIKKREPWHCNKTKEKNMATSTKKAAPKKAVAKKAAPKKVAKKPAAKKTAKK